MKLDYYKNLDGIRAIAALMVMIFHFFGEINFFGEIKNGAPYLAYLFKISVFGQTGVTLFFVLSGFLITRILLQTKKSDNFFKNFYLRRTLRIFPLYYLFLIISYFIVPLLHNKSIPSFNDQLVFYAYLQNLAITFNWKAEGPGHFWSLAVEEHFYLFWPFAVFMLNRRNLYYFIGFIMIFAFGLRLYMLDLNYEVFYFTFTRFDSLAIGSLLALFELENIFSQGNSKKFLLGTLILMIPTILLWTIFTGESNYIIQAIKYDLISLIYFTLIGYILCLKKQSFINKILNTSTLNYTGKISYGLYVYHPLAYSITREFFYSKNIVLLFITSFVCSYLLATISFYLFENKFLYLKKYFEYSSKKNNEVLA